MRGSSKHGPRLDEEMAAEVAGLTRGGPADGRKEEWHEAEPPADGEPEPSFALYGHSGVDTDNDLDPDFREHRARIGAYVPQSIFPTTGAELVAHAREANAPDDVIESLEALKQGHRLANAQQLWAALGLSSGPRF